MPNRIHNLSQISKTALRDVMTLWLTLLCAVGSAGFLLATA